MQIWRKIVVAVAPLMLTGCLWGPGKFTSNLTLNRNGTFVLDYQGEVVLATPDDKGPPLAWDDKFAHCYKDGRTKTITADVSSGSEISDEIWRPCTSAEVNDLKVEFEKQRAEQAAEQDKKNERMAKLFGLPGPDDASNQRFAANLMKYQGWRSVVYKGQRVFDVDYHVEGRLTQDYAFPLMPGTDIIIPFITIRRRTDGSVMVSAPALTGGTGPLSARAKMWGLDDKGDDGDEPVSRAEGRFTVTTNGEILTNNSEDGPMVVPGGRRQVHWEVNPGSSKIPEMLVKL